MGTLGFLGGSGGFNGADDRYNEQISGGSANDRYTAKASGAPDLFKQAKQTQAIVYGALAAPAVGVTFFDEAKKYFSNLFKGGVNPAAIKQGISDYTTVKSVLDNPDQILKQYLPSDVLDGLETASALLTPAPQKNQLAPVNNISAPAQTYQLPAGAGGTIAILLSVGLISYFYFKRKK